MFGSRTRETFNGFEYIPIDCSRVKNGADLEAKLFLDILDPAVPRICFLDEVHCLQAKAIEEVLLKPLEENEAIWILATAKPELLDPMLVGRVTQLETQSPGADELRAWIIDRSKEYQIQISADDVQELADRDFDAPGKILNKLKLKQMLNFR